MTDILLEALHGGPSAVIVVDGDCTLQTTHRILAERSGCPPAELVGRAAWHAAVPISAAGWPALRAEALRDGATEYEAPDGPGARRARVRIEPVGGPPGASRFLIRLEPLARPATPRRPPAGWLDRVPTPLFVYGPDGALLQWNRAAANWLGASSGDALTAADGSQMADWRLSDEDGQPLPQEDVPLERVLQSGEPVFDVVVNHRIGQRLRWSQISAAPVFDERGELSEVVVSATDLTLARRSESARARTQRLESLGRMAGGVAHDFNNLLTVVRSAAEMVAIDLPPGSPSVEDLAELRLAADRGAALTRRLLGSTRGLPGNPRPQHLGRLIARAESIVQRQLPPSVTLSVTADDDLWPVRFDAALFEQVLLNLVVNACDAMWPGGGALDITLRNVAAEVADVGLRVEGDHVVLTVTDTGCGMSEDVRSRAFDPFFTTKDAASNTGLGLSTCYSITRQHGGEVYLDSEPGRGTRVEVWLPRVVGARGHTPQGSPRRAGEATAPGGPGMLQRSENTPSRPLANSLPTGAEGAVWGGLAGSAAPDAHSRKPPSMSKQRPVK